ncbi:hypothetical protein RJ639_015824 [Escallonia herrerae]|uniref:Reverse transcriptase/retrotransposon-derived protein RNase H-like domain-containing protein n=1 Tax=Escallonia herrerae TaxID=1293975 RepID=A0AA89AP32_9ASTE|nr:hypothetical protein RJ639_015824 [Escallonia herrerae]
MCRAFPTTLRKAAHVWFKSLQPRFIHSFAQLSDLFQKHFVSSCPRRKNLASLLNIVHEKNESLAYYLERFNAATLEFDNLDESVKYTAFLRGLRPTSKFAFSVYKSPPGNMKALLEKANKVLVDNGSFAEVLFYDAFKKMNIPTDRLRKMDTPVYEFSNYPVAVEGIITCPITIVYPGKKDKTVWIGSNLKEDTKLELSHQGSKDFAWTDDCQNSFEELKAYLSSPPLLSKPILKEDLFLYLSVTKGTVSTVLVKEGDGVQKPIYYVNKVLQDVETRYLKIDKIALALITSPRCLRPYFKSHTIIVLTDQPRRKVLLSPEASGRLLNWLVELGEFDIQYKPRTTIKAQALADFIVKCTLPEDPPQLVISEVQDSWNLYVDGSSAIGNSGAGIILISPESFVVEYALHFGFSGLK